MKRIIIACSMCVVVAGVIYGGLFLYFHTQIKKLDAQVQQNFLEAEKKLAEIPIWHKKITTDQIVKIGIITDTHVHPTRINRGDKRNDAPRYLEWSYAKPLRDFVTHMQAFQPAHIIHVGDVIEGTNEKNAVGVQGLELIKKELDKTGVPVHWTLGNHDLRAVTKDQFRQALGQNDLSQSFDVGDYRFIVWDVNQDVTLEELLQDERGETEEEEAKEVAEGKDGDQNIDGGHVLQADIAWLMEQLATDKRVFVFCHYPLFTQSIMSADGYPKKSVPNAKEIQAIFDEYRVDGVFAGHVEARMYFQDQLTHYYVMTGTKKSETYPESYYELTIDKGWPDMTMYYTSPIDYKQHKVNFENGEK